MQDSSLVTDHRVVNSNSRREALDNEVNVYLRVREIVANESSPLRHAITSSLRAQLPWNLTGLLSQQN